MKFDDILLEVGEFGRYQKMQYFMVCLVAIISAFHGMNMVFLGAKPDYRCKIITDNRPKWGQLANLSDAELTTALIPKDSQCTMYGINDTKNVIDWNVNGSMVFEGNRSVTSCKDGWWYSKRVYASTIVSSFDLVCTEEWLRSTSKSLYFVGRLIGAVTFGHLSDRFGRRPCFFVAAVLQTLAGIGISLSPNIIIFLILYVLQGIAQVGVFLIAFTIGNELSVPRYRFITGNILHMFYSIGYMMLAAIAYGTNDWRYLELAITLPGLLFISYWWLLPESVMWLLSQGKSTEAIKILKKVAKINKKVLDQESIDRINADNEKQILVNTTHTAIDLLRRASTAIMSMNVWIAWAVNSMVYYGLSLNTNNLGGSPYLNFCIAGAVEMPAFILCLLILDKVGRKPPLVVFMLIGGVTCIISGFMPQDMMTLGMVFAMIGKFAITASYTIIYLIGAEIFPTTHRNAGLGVASMSARIGGIICPQILELQSFYAPLPLLVFGSAAIVSGLLCILLPETMGQPMPQTIDDLSAMIKKKGKSSMIEEIEIKEEKDTKI